MTTMIDLDQNREGDDWEGICRLILILSERVVPPGN
jgi:hypothetical protein